MVAAKCEVKGRRHMCALNEMAICKLKCKHTANFLWKFRDIKWVYHYFEGTVYIP